MYLYPREPYNLGLIEKKKIVSTYVEVLKKSKSIIMKSVNEITLSTSNNDK